MRRSICFLFLLLYFAAPADKAIAQAAQEPLEITQSSKEYQAAIRFRGVQSDVAYFDPTRPAPPLNTTERPPPPERTERDGWRLSDIDTPTGLVTIAILIFIAVLFARYGGAARLVLRNAPDDAARQAREEHDASPFGNAASRDLSAILANNQRRAALIELVQLLISRAVNANGLLLQRSWTARDVLRRLPMDLSYLPELKELVLIGERVHFGERPVSEDDFAQFVSRAKPLLKALDR